MTIREELGMHFEPTLPGDLALVHVFGAGSCIEDVFASIEQLRAWTPTTTVTGIQVHTMRAGYRHEAAQTVRDDGTSVGVEDGMLVITTASGAEDPIQSALAAYDWAYAPQEK